ncbi:ECF transporter S component [Parasporobacterium paucivorans]|uniref:Riboflavin transporter n=1 Tax=Parasporobacterium paucivorans DSM 15970 TaxID=1122934 RepID=A0A1M6FM88_9FIRM|nr:ECF transporter S component [Parasporobacterium paucivorans]SHI98848.1 Riboflavin transporter FmnP [Parasporobacterium paucivorans DSM 15970]
MSAKKLTFMAALTAISIILVALIHFPIFPAAAYLEYDPADIPILIGTFAFGPMAGIMITIVASLIQGLTVSAASGIYGILMHILATGTYVVVAGNIYKRNKKRNGTILALVCGTVAMAVMMCVANLILTPIFYGVPVDVIKTMILPIILPFNLIKAGINGLVTFIIYKTVAKFIKL